MYNKYICYLQYIDSNISLLKSVGAHVSTSCFLNHGLLYTMHALRFEREVVDPGCNRSIQDRPDKRPLTFKWEKEGDRENERRKERQRKRGSESERGEREREREREVAEVEIDRSRTDPRIITQVPT